LNKFKLIHYIRLATAVIRTTIEEKIQYIDYIRLLTATSIYLHNKYPPFRKCARDLFIAARYIGLFCVRINGYSSSGLLLLYLFYSLLCEYDGEDKAHNCKHNHTAKSLVVIPRFVAHPSKERI